MTSNPTPPYPSPFANGYCPRCYFYPMYPGIQNNLPVPPFSEEHRTAINNLHQNLIFFDPFGHVSMPNRDRTNETRAERDKPGPLCKKRKHEDENAQKARKRRSRDETGSMTNEFPPPFKFKEEKDIEKVEAERRELKLIKKSKKRVIEEVLALAGVKKTGGKVKKTKKKPKVVPGWYSKRYGKQMFDKVSVSVKKVTKDEIKAAAPRPRPVFTNPPSPPKASVFPVAIWNIKDIIPLKPLEFAKDPGTSNTSSDYITNDPLITNGAVDASKLENIDWNVDHDNIKDDMLRELDLMISGDPVSLPKSSFAATSDVSCIDEETTEETAALNDEIKEGESQESQKIEGQEVKKSDTSIKETKTEDLIVSMDIQESKTEDLAHVLEELVDLTESSNDLKEEETLKVDAGLKDVKSADFSESKDEPKSESHVVDDDMVDLTECDDDSKVEEPPESQESVKETKLKAWTESDDEPISNLIVDLVDLTGVDDDQKVKGLKCETPGASLKDENIEEPPVKIKDLPHDVVDLTESDAVLKLEDTSLAASIANMDLDKLDEIFNDLLEPGNNEPLIDSLPSSQEDSLLGESLADKETIEVESVEVKDVKAIRSQLCDDPLIIDPLNTDEGRAGPALDILKSVTIIKDKQN